MQTEEVSQKTAYETKIMQRDCVIRHKTLREGCKIFTFQRWIMERSCSLLNFKYIFENLFFSKYYSSPLSLTLDFQSQPSKHQQSWTSPNSSDILNDTNSHRLLNQFIACESLSLVADKKWLLQKSMPSPPATEHLTKRK